MAEPLEIAFSWPEAVELLPTIPAALQPFKVERVREAALAVLERLSAALEEPQATAEMPSLPEALAGPHRAMPEAS